jgi:sirohydrochlorin cobaltochelatase
VVVDGLAVALQKAQAENYTTVIVLPTQLLCGDEYEKIRQRTQAFSQFFPVLRMALPLLAMPCDICDVANVLSEKFPQEKGRAVVLMGHGTDHAANRSYADLQSELIRRDRRDIFMGTMEKEPGISDVMAQIAYGCFHNVTLSPLMLTAGRHAEKFLAGDGTGSWKAILQQKGYTVDITMRGLGEMEEIRVIYERHVQNVL